MLTRWWLDAHGRRHEAALHPGLGGLLRGVRTVLVLMLALGAAIMPPTIVEADSGLSGGLPSGGGFGLVIWSGGPIYRLPSVTAREGCSALSAWVAPPGSSELVGYVFAAPSVVNRRFASMFRNTSLEARTVIIVVCEKATPVVNDLSALPANVKPQTESGVTTADQEAVMRGALSVERYLQGTMGTGLLRANTIRLRSDAQGIPSSGTDTSVCCYAQGLGLAGGAMTIHAGHSSWIATGMVAGTDYPGKSKTAAHEYAHLWGYEMSCITTSVPLWFTEGVAEHLALRSAEAASLISTSQRRNYEIRQAVSVPTTISLQSMESQGGFYGAAIWGAYGLASEAIGQLLRERDPALIRDFCADIASGRAWPQALERAFGTSRESFYASFESYRTTLKLP